MTADNRLGRDFRMRNFLVVVTAEQEVVQLVASPRERASNVGVIDAAFVKTYGDLEEQFPRPEHKVIAVRAPYSYFDAAKKRFPQYRGWETVKREELAIE